MTLYILDSDHLSLYQRGHESLRKRLLTVSPEQIAITIISAEELLRGRFAQVRKAKDSVTRVRSYHWLSKTVDFLCGYTILKYDDDAEAHFQNFRDHKIKIGAQDLKIAAIAFNQNRTLVTRNRRDFDQVPGLRIEDWSAPFVSE